MRKITTGPADASNTAITTGLSAGEKVVIDGADRLREGAEGASCATPPAPGAGRERRRQRAPP